MRMQIFALDDKILISIILGKYLEMRLLDHMALLLFLRGIHTVFHKDCTISQSHQQLTRVNFSQYTYQYLLPHF